MTRWLFAIAALFSSLAVWAASKAQVLEPQIARQAAARQSTTPQTSSVMTRSTWSGEPVPRFASLKFNAVNGRSGPSLDHPILWRYRHEGLPVKVIAETENWRKIRDPLGDEVWVHRRTLSGRRTAMISVPRARDVVVRRRPDRHGHAVAVVESGVVVDVERCLHGWCRVEGARASGWLPEGVLWGASPNSAQNLVRQAVSAASRRG